jgi:hypothetical protein
LLGFDSLRRHSEIQPSLQGKAWPSNPKHPARPLRFEPAYFEGMDSVGVRAKHSRREICSAAGIDLAAVEDASDGKALDVLRRDGGGDHILRRCLRGARET